MKPGELLENVLQVDRSQYGVSFPFLGSRRIICSASENITVSGIYKDRGLPGLAHLLFSLEVNTTALI